MLEQYVNLIDGEWIESDNRESIEIIDPATEDILGRVAHSEKADIDAAVDSARRAFRKSWIDVKPVERARRLMEIAGRITREKDFLARLESRDTGKPLSQARADCEVAARYFEFFAGVADKIHGETIPMGPGFVNYTVREPLGVTAHIIPWNYPLQIAARGFAPALAAGNTVVAKPAEDACLAVLELGRICQEAGIPKGVVNIVTGLGEQAGAALASHPDIDLLCFTGSVATGSAVMSAAARNIKPVMLELGGKCPNLVFADAAQERLLPVIVKAAFQNAGQTCTAASRLLVEESIHDELLERLTLEVRQMQLGKGENDPDMGPLISEVQWGRVSDYMAIAKKEGSEIVCGGGRPGEFRKGYFFSPTVIDGVGLDDRLNKEEIFGPVITVSSFHDAEEAVALANATDYGLTAGIWTNDINRAHDLSNRLQVGQVYVNGYGAGGGVELPFGGYRKSGFGREKGVLATQYYTQVKNININLG